MSKLFYNLLTYIKNVFERDSFVENYRKSLNFKSKYYFQLVTSWAFFLLSVINVVAGSYTMLIFTASGCVVNVIFAFIAKKYKSSILCALSAVSTCSVLFGFFVINGGNDGFACLWVIILPFLSMVVMDFKIGLCISGFFQIFLIVVFWTPVRYHLLYQYNDQFCLRFPMFFLVTFVMGLLLTMSLRRSEYYECKHLIDMEKMADIARVMARSDPLTKLANRRFVYEEFETKYIAEGSPHCIIMGDVDNFKKINDTYGHEFGDEVLTIIADYFNKLLPENYLKSRWGGEEFLFAADAPTDEVYEIVENLRKTVEAHEFHCDGAPVHITITFGIAEYYGKDGLAKAISVADDRLYMGKNATKNCTVMK